MKLSELIEMATTGGLDKISKGLILNAAHGRFYVSVPVLPDGVREELEAHGYKIEILEDEIVGKQILVKWDHMAEDTP